MLSDSILLVTARIKFSKRFDFSHLPKDWKVSRAAVDWKGDPLLLVEEGKPPYPKNDASTDARMAWLNTPPKGHHLIHWDGLSQRTLKFEKSTGLSIFHVQPFGKGWLLGEARGGRADVYDGAGQPRRSFDLGDASNDVQTTPNGHIWVSYFDEGVFGHGLGSHGVVCFDSKGEPIFKYSEFAEENQLPFVADCYAMNVVNEQDVWLSYYTDFPLVSMKNFRLHRIWKDFGCMDRAFALDGGSVVFPKCYTRREGKPQLLRRTLADSAKAELLDMIDEAGVSLGGLFTAVARGPHFYLLTETALYESRTA
jgi:hypothetical protein